MQVFTPKQTFSGAGLDQRYARDDIEEPVLREREQYGQTDNDQDDDPMPTKEDDEQQVEESWDDTRGKKHE